MVVGLPVMSVHALLPPCTVPLYHLPLVALYISTCPFVGLLMAVSVSAASVVEPPAVPYSHLPVLLL